MTKNTLESVDISSDHWVIKESDKKFIFDFNKIANGWFRQTLKNYVYSSLENNMNTFTIRNYFKSAVSFFNFLSLQGYPIQSFSEVDHELLRKFNEYLVNRYSTKTHMTGLKNVINFGTNLNLEGYPKDDPFNINYWLFNPDDTEGSKNNNYWIVSTGKSFHFHFDIFPTLAFNRSIKELIFILLKTETRSSEYVYTLFLYVRFFINTLNS
ncbi:hypothetical protein P4V64_05910, partial [Bacillus thuringiensis]|nr:hypothetical protein [Bacillus thuringiensis]